LLSFELNEYYSDKIYALVRIAFGPEALALGAKFNDCRPIRSRKQRLLCLANTKQRQKCYYLNIKAEAQTMFR
jgi:hypothetical protein